MVLSPAPSNQKGISHYLIALVSLILSSILIHSPLLLSVPLYPKGLRGQLGCFTAALVLLAGEQHYKH